MNKNYVLMIDIICFENIKLSLDKYVTCENE